MQHMVLLGVMVDPELLQLSLAERVALAVLSSAIATGTCVCGGEWETVSDDNGNAYPSMLHEGHCPGTSKTGQTAVRKVIKHIIFSTLVTQEDSDDEE